MYSVFAKLCETHNVKPASVARATGIATSTLTNWKKGNYVPKADKLQKIADYFGVSLEYIRTGEQPEHESISGKKYYFDDKSAEIAQMIFENNYYQALFDSAQGNPPDNVALATEFLNRMKATNPEG